MLAMLVVLMAMGASANAQNRLIIEADRGEYTINRHIYGHFSEHLGRCIYGGYWLRRFRYTQYPGIRNDVVQALKDIRIPNLRWPGDVLQMSTTGWME